MTEIKGDPTERRRFTRIAFDANTELQANQTDWQTELVDISLHGLLLKHPEGFAGNTGDNVVVKMQLIAEEVELTLPARLAWVKPPLIGLETQDIELETAVHLRRIVELNLGDEALLGRELQQLAHPED